MIRMTLTEEKNQELEGFWRGAVGRVVLRALVILWLSWGRSVPEIAAWLRWDEDTVRDCIHRYREEGVAGLVDRPRSGRPRRADAAVEAALEATLAPPQEPTEGAPGVVTTKALRQRIGDRLGKWVSRDTIRRALGRLKYVWRRPRVVLTEAPEDVVAACAPLREALDEASADTHVVLEDETDVQVFPDVRSCWQKRGQRRDLPVTGKHSRRTLFGGLLLTLKGGLQVAAEPFVPLLKARKRGIEVIAWLEQLVQALPTGPILLIWDSTSTHTCKAVQAWLDLHPRITVLPLPKYCPRANPLEDLWGVLKTQVQADRYWSSLPPLEKAVNEFVAALTRDDLLRICEKRIRKNFCTAA